MNLFVFVISQKPHALPKLDQFIKDFGYSYDYVFVCQVYDELDSNFNPVSINLSASRVRSSFSTARTIIIVSVGADNGEYYRAVIERGFRGEIFLLLSER